jgi:hypothetical protein
MSGKRYCDEALEAAGKKPAGGADKKASSGRVRSQSDAVDIEKLEAATEGLTDEPDILARFDASVEAAGLVGENDNAKILFLALTTRPFERLVSVAIKGASSVGKSHLVKCVLRHFPPEAYIERTGLSEKALAYSEENFRHRHLIIYEATGLNSEYGSYLIRTLLSEGKLIYEFVEKTKKGMRPRIIQKEGPTGLITTTTSPRLHPENETRLLSLSSKDNQEQTEAVIAALAANACNGGATKPVSYDRWHALQRWIMAGERRVVVPFAMALGQLIPPVAVRLRRDFTLLLSLVRAHAIAHRRNRECNDEGCVVASLADYAAVRELVVHLFAEGIGATVPQTVRETVAAVEKLGRDVSAAAVGRLLELDRSTISYRVNKALDCGFLVNSETGKGRPSKLSVGDPIPDGQEILPEISKLQNRWSVGAGSGGDTRKNPGEQTGPDISSSSIYPPLNVPTLQRSDGEADEVADVAKPLLAGPAANGIGICEPANICAQCQAGPSTDPPSDAPTEVVIHDGELKRLHPECKPFWVREHAS